MHNNGLSLPPSRMISVGKLVGHNGAVGTMTIVDGKLLATGSRDRLIKVLYVHVFVPTLFT